MDGVDSMLRQLLAKEIREPARFGRNHGLVGGVKETGKG